MAPEPPARLPEASILSATQWLAIASLIFSLIGIYYKCEELKAVFTKKPEQVHSPAPRPVEGPQPFGTAGVPAQPKKKKNSPHGLK